MRKFPYLNIFVCLFFLLGSIGYTNGVQTQENSTSTNHENITYQNMNESTMINDPTAMDRHSGSEIYSMKDEPSPFSDFSYSSADLFSRTGKVNSYNPHGFVDVTPTVKISSILYNETSAISIIGDSGFIGFPGSGTVTDPYRIEGWNITASSGNLIYLSGTTAHFKIVNNLLNGMNTALRGIHLYNVVNGTIGNNFIGNMTSSGIRMEYSNNNIIANSTIHNNQGWAGIEIRYSADNNIVNNTVFNNYNGNGISLYSSNDNLVANNSAYNNNYRGIRLEYSDNNEILNNTAHNNNEDGIWFWYSDNNLISNNTAYSNTYIGIRLEYSNINTISVNTVFDNQGWTGMWLQFSNSNTITNNTAFSNNGNGIDVTEVNGNIISNNTAYNNLGNGINLWFNSINNVVTNNTVYNNSNGIMLTSSTLNTISSNVANENSMGIFLSSSSTQNTISSNDAYDNNYGLFSTGSGNNVVSKNNFTNNGILILSSTVEDSLQQSVVNNLVNGKPLIYLQSVIGGTVQSGAGQVILINCTGVTVINQNITNASIGIWVGFSSGIIIDSNQLANHRYGISLSFSDDNLLFNNTNHKILFQDITLEDSDNNILRNNYLLSNNSRYGNNFLLGKLHLERSDYNLIINNTISNSLNNTIRLIDSHNNAITSNLISNNTGYGIISDDLSQGNVIQLNDFIDNNIGGSQVFDDGINIFEYNHWSDWTSPDNDVDGFVDGPYLLEGLSNNIDPFPLVTSTSNHYLLPPPVLTSTIEGQTFSKSIALNWKQSIDTWGFAVTFNFFYSNDGGTTWNLIVSDLIDTSFIWDLPSLVDGSNYKLKIDAISLGGPTNTYIMTGFFSIDQTPPTVIIEEPLTGTILTSTTVEITLSGDAFNYWYNIESMDTTNQTWSPTLMRLFPNGIYTLHAYGEDALGNVAHVQVTFTVDAPMPVVQIESPIAYTNDDVTIILSGDAGAYWYYIESVDPTNQTWTSSVNRSLPEGTYILHAYGGHLLGNVAHVQVTFTVDSTPPNIIIESPITDTYTSGEVTITLSGDATTYWYKIESEDTTNQTWTSSVTRTLADGTYTLHAYGSDQAGNIVHVQVIFTIDKPTPISSPTSDTSTPTSSLQSEKKSDEGPFPITQNYVILFSIFTMITLVRNKRSNKLR